MCSALELDVQAYAIAAVVQFHDVGDVSNIVVNNIFCGFWGTPEHRVVAQLAEEAAIVGCFNCILDAPKIQCINLQKKITHSFLVTVGLFTVRIELWTTIPNAFLILYM